MNGFTSFVLFFVNILASILFWAILIRAILSWFPIKQENQLFVILNQITEPVLAPLRRVIPSLGFIDITPLVALILLQFIMQITASGMPF